MAEKRYWLMKSEPGTYSLDDLRRDGKTAWDSIRNYQARNFMQQDMRRGDDVLFYHSNSEPAGIAGVARVASDTARADDTSWDKKSDYFDPESTPSQPRWFMVDIEFVAKFAHFVTLAEIKETAELKEMWVIRRGMRLSIQPVDKKHFQFIQKLGQTV